MIFERGKISLVPIVFIVSEFEPIGFKFESSNTESGKSAFKLP